MTEASAAPQRGWVFGPLSDLLFGCGLAWMAIFALRAGLGADFAAGVPGAALIFLFAIPHYGATLILVYQSPASRRKYTLFSIYASLALVVFLAVSVRSALVGSLILTLYLTWSPWHYTGQNYGVFLILLGRRGEKPTQGLKRLIYASFFCSFLLSFLSMHGTVGATYVPLSYGGTVFRLIPLGIPNAATWALVLLAGIGYLGCSALAIANLLRRHSLRAVAPALVLMATQALWFAVPVLIRQWRLYVGDSTQLELYTAYGFIWIAAAHSVQYLWICTYYAAGAGSRPKAAAYLGKACLAGYAVWVLPGVLFAPRLLGDLPSEAGLTVMVAATVNLHHFILDGAIWKLRDGKIARLLFRGERGARVSLMGGRSRGFAVALGLMGALAFACVIINHVAEKYGFQQALEKDDLTRAKVALTVLSWIGNDSPRRHDRLGRRYARIGEVEPAMREFRRSLELLPNADAWRSIAQLREEAGQLHEAQLAYGSALELDARHVASLIGSGSLWIRRGRSDLALPLLERADRISPDDPKLQAPLQRARREMGVAENRRKG
jgi:tetratricopeptide (TPR) repeat protein